MPQLVFVKEGISVPIFSTNVDPLVDLNREVPIPTDGVTSIFLRYTDTHVRELIVLSGTTSLAISTTRYKDGTTIASKLEPNQEIVGYYGYVDDDNSLRAIGLFVYNH